MTSWLSRIDCLSLRLEHFYVDSFGYTSKNIAVDINSGSGLSINETTLCGSLLPTSCDNQLRLEAPKIELSGFILAVPQIFFFQAEDGIRDRTVTGVQTCALPI